ncbi:MAG: alanine racemase [Chloroflexota bacterium]|nr:alanine racemase [Chloroflexota bacterium]
MASENIPLRPAWVEVDLGAIEHNTRRLIEIVGPHVELMAMVKANAYGHGAVEVSRAALRGGATWLGVVSVGEGIELRRAHIDAPIFVLGPTPPIWSRAAVENNLVLNIFSPDTAQAISDAARESRTRVRAHIKIDTGLTRLGVMPDQAVEFASAVRDLGNIEIEGIFTHFSMADMPDAFGVAGWGNQYTQQQLARFREVLDRLERAGIHARYRHCANSPAALNLPEARFNLIRSGILIYGLDPSDQAPRPPGFIPALSFKAPVAQVKQVPTGTYVSYGATFRTERPSRLAVIMVGYADGFRRTPNNYGEVLVHGKRARIAGRVAMDQAIIDVTDIDGVQAGDEVVLIGRQGAEEIRAEEIARNLETNDYEVVTAISARVARKYK